MQVLREEAQDGAEPGRAGATAHRREALPVCAVLVRLRLGQRPQPAQEGRAQDSAEGRPDRLVQEGEEQRVAVLSIKFLQTLLENTKMSTLLNKSFNHEKIMKSRCMRTKCASGRKYRPTGNPHLRKAKKGLLPLVRPNSSSFNQSPKPEIETQSCLWPHSNGHHPCVTWPLECVKNERCL